MGQVTVRSVGAKLEQEISVGAHRLVADAPADKGGDDHGAEPHDLLSAALGSCTSMTVVMYARRKQWPLRAITVRVDLDRQDGAEGHVTHIRRDIALDGPELTAEQRARLIDIANKCPVHKILTGKIDVTTKEAP